MDYLISFKSNRNIIINSNQGVVMHNFRPNTNYRHSGIQNLQRETGHIHFLNRPFPNMADTKYQIENCVKPTPHRCDNISQIYNPTEPKRESNWPLKSTRIPIYIYLYSYLSIYICIFPLSPPPSTPLQAPPVKDIVPISPEHEVIGEFLREQTPGMSNSASSIGESVVHVVDIGSLACLQHSEAIGHVPQTAAEDTDLFRAP